MSVDRVLPYYVGTCIVSLFTGVTYETDVLVLRPFDVMIGAALVVTVAAAARRGYARRLDKGLPYYLFAALYLYRGLSGLVMTGPVLAVKELIQGFEFLVLIHLVAQAVKEKDNRLRFLQTLYVEFGVIAVVTALLHIAEGQYSGYKYLSQFGYTSGEGVKYVFGPFGLMAMVFWVSDQRERGALLVFALSLLLVVLSGERKAWVALLIAVMAIYYTKTNFRAKSFYKKLLHPKYILIAITIACTMYLGSNYEYSNRQLGNLRNTYNTLVVNDFGYRYANETDVGRYNGLVFIYNTLSEKPVFGVGTERGKKVLESIAPSGIHISTGHGEYQRFALENGIVGLFLYVSIWVCLVFTIRKIQSNYLSSLFIVGFITYSIVVNMFMGGGAYNVMFLSLSIGFARMLELSTNNK